MTTELVALRQSLFILGNCINSLENELKLLENGSLDNELQVYLSSSFDLSEVNFKFLFPSVPVLLQADNVRLVDFETVDADLSESKGHKSVAANDESDDTPPILPQGNKKRHRSMSSASLKNGVSFEDKCDDDIAVFKGSVVLPTSDVESLDDELSITATSSVTKTYGKNSGFQRRSHVVHAESPSILDPPHSAEFTPKRSSRLSKK
jgi:hypothetical protein